MSDVVDISSTPAWRRSRRTTGDGRHQLAPALRRDPARQQDVAGAAELVLDYSKHLATDETSPCWSSWHAPPAWRSAATPCSRPAHQHHRERAVLHIALRSHETHLGRRRPDVVADVHRCSTGWASSQRDPLGTWRGHRERIRAVVNIGIGGSDLARMAYEALLDYADPESGAASSRTSTRRPLEQDP